MQTIDTTTRPRSLDEARAHLSQLRKTATERGIQLPSGEIPRTLDRAKSMIADFKQRLSLGGATSSLIPPPKTEVAAPSKSSETLFSEAGAIAARYRQSVGRSPESRPSLAVDEKNLSRSELMAAIENQRGNREKLGALFGELRRRERGEPSRRSIDATNEQLENMIENEKNVERRQELFQILTRQARKN